MHNVLQCEADQPESEFRNGRYFVPEIETMGREAISALQLKKLRRILHHAYDNVAHYQRGFNAAGVSPHDLRTLDDLARFPFTTKDDLRDNYPFGLFAVPRRELRRIQASSGTTGKPIVVGYTKEDLDIWASLMARCLVAAGVEPGDMVHNALGYGLFTGGLGFHQGAELLGCAITPASCGATERQMILIEDLEARVLCATPSYALYLAEAAERQGVDFRRLPLSIGIFGAEPWSLSLRDLLQNRLGIMAIDLYGLSEITGPGVAVECKEAQNGLHGWEDCFLFEVIDPETEARLPFGETGELVITTLAKWAQPMIRYRTRDITRLDPTPCTCGRTHVRLMRITGRSDDMLIIRGVNVYPSQIEALLIGQPGIEPYYQLIVEREGAMDTLTIDVEATPGTPEDRFDEIARGLERHIRSSIGLSCHTRVLEHRRVPRSHGKAVRVRDLRPKP